MDWRRVRWGNVGRLAALVAAGALLASAGRGCRQESQAPVPERRWRPEIKPEPRAEQPEPRRQRRKRRAVKAPRVPAALPPAPAVVPPDVPPAKAPAAPPAQPPPRHGEFTPDPG